MKIAAAPIIWSNDDMHDLGAHISLNQCLSDMQRIGYQGCEIGHKFPSAVDDIEAVMQEYQLEICNQWFSFCFTTQPLSDNLDRLTSHAKKLKSLGAKVVGGAEVGNSWHQTDRPLFPKTSASMEHWMKLCKGLNEAAKILEDMGMRLAYHPHMGSMVQSDREVSRLMESTAEGVGLNYDSGHCYLSGGDPVALFRYTESRIKHIHLKDVRQSIIKKVMDERMDFLDAVRAGIFTVPGDPEGSIDFDTLILQIKESQYSGWIVVEAEQDPAQADPYSYAKMGYEYLSTRL